MLKTVSRLEIFFRGKIYNIRSQKNDLIIWNMRTHHAGRFKLFKFFPSVSINPYIERLLPNFLFKKRKKRDLHILLLLAKIKENNLKDFIKTI